MRKFFTIILAVIIVCASNIHFSNANESHTDSDTKLGGGPSPSAAWTYKYSGAEYFTASEIDELSGEMQGVIGSSSYKRGQLAYNASVAAVGFMGWSNSTKVLFSVSAAGWSLFGSSYFSAIQSSANELARAGSLNKGQILTYKVYWRPANQEHILIFY